MRIHQRVKLRTLILVLIVLTSGCTSAFVYNRIDTVLAWHVEGLVTLNKSQRAELRSWLGQTLEWHRASELTKYAQFLRTLADAAERGATRATFEDAERKFRSFTRELAERTAPDGARLLLALSDAQVDELLANLEERALERLSEEEELVARGRWQERRAKQIEKQVARWTGTVDRGQREMIRAAALELQPSYPEWLASQREWRKALRTLISKGRDDPEYAQRELTSLLISPEEFWNEAYRSKLAHNRERTIDLFVSLDRRLTPEQRSHLGDRFARLASELESLAREPTRAAAARSAKSSG